MRSAWIGILTLLTCGGCNTEDGTDLHPVRGTVTRGGKPATGGSIQFLPLSEPNRRAVGEIGSVGRFALYTLGSKGRNAGAGAGNYKVILAFSAQEAPIQPDTIYTVEPRDNTFTIALP